MTTPDQAHAFISFSSKDEKQARAVCDDMERRGVRCWISSRDVRPGRNYQTEIIEAIRTATHLLLVFSANADRSEEISRELSLASKHQIRICPVRIEDVQPQGGMEFMLATSQWVDAFRDWKDAMDRLANELATPGAPRTIIASAPARRLPLVAGAVVGLLLVAGGIGFWATHRGPGPKEILGRVDTLAGTLGCAGVSVARSGDGSVILTGFVGSAADQQRLVAAARPLAVVNQLAVEPWPFCAVRSLGPALGARDDITIELNHPDDRYALGDDFSGSFIVTGDEPMWVRLELVDSQGTVASLLPTASTRSAFGASERVVFGVASPGTFALAAQPPTGPEMLLVIASDKQLPERAFDTEEKASTYLPALQTMLAQLGATLAISTRGVTVVQQR